MNNEKGQKICAIVKLKNRIDGHHANTTEDSQVLKEVVLEKKRNEKIETWIKEKIQKTYIKIDPAWKNCDFKYSGWIK
jgi:peptidyl-prolyl cis-trans isomerase SurA